MMKLVVLSCILATASASVVAPYAPLIYSAYAAPFAAHNYSGPLSLAPGQPADVIAADGRPLDTLDVNLDRAAHYTAKALEPFHLLKKRSATFIAPAVNTYALASTPLITPASPITYTAPLAAPLTHLTYTSTPLVHVLKKRSAPELAPFAKLAVAPAPFIARADAITYSAPYGAGHITPFTYAATLSTLTGTNKMIYQVV